MDLSTEIFERVNLQQLRSFFTTGCDAVRITDAPYEERLSDRWNYMKNIIKERYPDMNDYEKIQADIDEYIMETENVYMELGIQCGAILMAQLLFGGR